MKIPPDPKHMNDVRAEWAEEGLFAFMEVTGMTPGPDDNEGIRDLITDLHHWFDRSGLEGTWENIIGSVDHHYRYETDPENVPTNPEGDPVKSTVYTVTVHRLFDHTATVEVEANDECTARQLAEEELDSYDTDQWEWANPTGWTDWSEVVEKV